MINLFFIEVDTTYLSEAFDQLITREAAVPILVERLEELSQAIELSLAEQVLHEELVHGNLKTRARVEILEGLHCCTQVTVIVFTA